MAAASRLEHCLSGNKEKLMLKVRFMKISIPVVLSTLLMAACGREQTGAVTPVALSTNPANLATGVPTTQIVTATFNVAMSSTTLNSVTFTLAGPGGAAGIGGGTPPPPQLQPGLPIKWAFRWQRILSGRLPPAPFPKSPLRSQ